MTADSSNPYSPPPISVQPEEAQRQSMLDWVAFIGWPIALGLNVIVPIMLGSSATSESGKSGMALAIGLWLVCGWVVCLAKSGLARKVILGSMLLSLTQFFPVLQFTAGIIAIGLSGVEFDVPGPKLDASAAFVVANLVAMMLLPIAAGLGWLTALMLPRSWFQERSVHMQENPR